MDDLTGPFREILPASPVIVEAGAHNGSDTLPLSWHAKHLHAFEPVPVLYNTLCVVTGGHPNITAHKLALGRRTGTQKMWVSGGGVNCDGSSSLLEPTEHREMFPHVSFAEPIDVETVTLSSWARRNNCHRIDGAWLDAQGTELEILKSAGRLLDTVRAIVLEVSLVELYDGCPLWPEVRWWLRRNGFAVIREEIDAGAPQGNVLVARL